MIWPHPVSALQALRLLRARPALLSLGTRLFYSSVPAWVLSPNMASLPPSPLTSSGCLLIFQFPAKKSCAQRKPPRSFILRQASRDSVCSLGSCHSRTHVIDNPGGQGWRETVGFLERNAQTKQAPPLHFVHPAPQAFDWVLLMV